jgi:8-hydroxy-5-deazaflavin:NADPH oxidoreductase
MRIGILGSGLLGGKLGTLFARAGREADAARDADALLRAVHWLRIDDVLQQAGDLSGKVLVICSLPMNAKNTDLVVALLLRR